MGIAGLICWDIGEYDNFLLNAVIIVLLIPLSKLPEHMGCWVFVRMPLKMDWLSPCAVPALSQLLGWDEALILPALV